MFQGFISIAIFCIWAGCDCPVWILHISIVALFFIFILEGDFHANLER